MARDLLPLSRVAVAVFALSVAACDDGCDKGGATTGDAGAAAPDSGVFRLPEAGTTNATPLPSASVEAAINPDKLPAYTGPTGSVEGTITVTGDPPPATPADFSRCPDAASTYDHLFREGPALPGGGRPLADAVVQVTGYKGFYLPERSEASELTIEGCAYTQRSLAITFGQRIDVKNLSKDFWSPHLQPSPRLVQMMALPHGDAIKFYPKHPDEPYAMLDHDRPYVRVDVLPFRHPLHAVSTIAGHYRIDGVPVGKLKVSVMHPRIADSASAEITIAADVVQKVDLVLKNDNREAGAPALDAAAPSARPKPSARAVPSVPPPKR